MNKYDDIINLVHPEPLNHARMPINKRASIFAPFAALTGFNEKIRDLEIDRDVKKNIDIDQKNELDLKIKNLNIVLKEEIVIRYYDNLNNKYTSVSDIIMKIDDINKCIVLKNKKKISFDDIIDIEKKEG